MTCPHCGSETSADGERCGTCARSIRTPGATAAKVARPSDPPPPDDVVTSFGVRLEAAAGVSPPTARASLPDDAATEDRAPITTGEETIAFGAPVQDRDATPAPGQADDDETGYLPAGFAISDGAQTMLQPTAVGPPEPTGARSPGVAPRTRARHTADRVTVAESVTGSLDAGAPGEPRPAPNAEGGPLARGQDFGKRYHIIRLLGIGGMGAVYKAWDAELNVAVAFKVIGPELAADPAAARSRRSLQAGTAARPAGDAQERRPHPRPRRDRRYQVHHNAVHRR